METTDNKTHTSRYCNGRHFHPAWMILGVIGFIGMMFLCGAIIMWLWNALMPAIFHLGILTYWQAVGLAILARLLFGFGHHGHPNGARRHKRFLWRRGNRMHHGNDPAMRWSYYEQYWNEEGERAFNDYVRRRTETPGA